MGNEKTRVENCEWTIRRREGRTGVGKDLEFLAFLVFPLDKNAKDCIIKMNIFNHFGIRNIGGIGNEKEFLEKGS